MEELPVVPLGPPAQAAKAESAKRQSTGRMALAAGFLPCINTAPQTPDTCSPRRAPLAETADTRYGRVS